MEVRSSTLRGTTEEANEVETFKTFRTFQLSLCDHGGLAQLARAPALQAGGQRFESVILHCGFWMERTKVSDNPITRHCRARIQAIFDVLTNVEAITSKEIYELFTSKK